MHATLTRLRRLAADLAPESDGRLLDAYLRGGEGAFRELVRRHGGLVYGVCHRVLRHRQDAEDAFQATFLVLARRAADVWPRDAVASWLHGVAYRVALKARSLRARRQSREQPVEDLPQPPRSNPEPDLAEVIDRAVRKLPEVYRAAVVACDLEGLSRRDAAERLGWKEGTLSGRLARARQLLADRLRKVGLSLPAGGVAAALGSDTPARAGLADSVVELACGGAAGRVPASVAALTEGVVPGMFAFNVKAVAAVAALVCGLGYGAWAAGAGDQPGFGSPPALAEGQPPPKAKEQPPVTPEKISPALRPLQGKWRVVSISEGKNRTVLTQDSYSTRIDAMKREQELRLWSYDDLGEVEIARNMLAMPYLEERSFRKRNEFKIAVDDTKNPKTIDLIAPNKPVGKGIYEFIAPATTCASCHTGTVGAFKPPIPDLIGLCVPGFKASHQQAGAKLRLAVATAGPRPTKFAGGAEGAIEFVLERIAADPTTERAKLAIEIAKAEEVLRIGKAAGARRAELELELAWLRVEEAKLEQDATRVIIDCAQAQVEEANKQFTIASGKLQEAVARLEEAQKAVAKGAAKPPAKAGASFTVHVRPLAAAEKVIRVNATGNETVLEGLAYAAEDMAIKPDALTVWVVRGREVMPVDLAGITQKGETKTNYVLKPGDQLFVQVKVGK